MLVRLYLMMCYHRYDLISSDWMKLIFHLGKQNDVRSLMRVKRMFLK